MLGAQSDARASCHSRIVRRKLWFGIKMLCSSSPPVSGLVDLVASQRLLRPALSPEARVALVCCIDPSEAHAEEALDVLGALHRRCDP